MKNRSYAKNRFCGKADIVEIDANQNDTSVILASIPAQNIYRNIHVKFIVDLIKKELKQVVFMQLHIMTLIKFM